ncbi:MAG: hypothetical protein ACOC4I_03545 [Spirochaetota bacterium]
MASLTEHLSIFIPIGRHEVEREDRLSDLLLNEVFQGLFDSVVWSSDLRDVRLNSRACLSLVDALRPAGHWIEDTWTPTTDTEHPSEGATPLISGGGEGFGCAELIDAIAPRALPERQRGAITTQVAAILMSAGRGISIDLRCFLQSELDSVVMDDPDTFAGRIITQIDEPDSFAYHLYNGLLALAPGFSGLCVRSYTRTAQDEGVYSAHINPCDSNEALWFIANTNRDAGDAGMSQDLTGAASQEEPLLFRDVLSDDLVYPHHDASGALTLTLEGYETLLLRGEPT